MQLNTIKFILVSLVIGLSSGCKTISPGELPPSDSSVQSSSAENSKVLERIAPQSIVAPGIEAEPEPPKGMIFAKTEFEGVVKRSFVRLTLIDQQDRSKVYQLYIGDKSRQLDFPWNAQSIQPGYFMIELPAGSYTIASLSIPVGSSLATELMNVTFEVNPEKTVYLGTLSVIGTKERVKFGGVPVIKPGFNYTVRIENEYAEAVQELTKHFTQDPADLEVHLMKDLGRE